MQVFWSISKNAELLDEKIILVWVHWWKISAVYESYREELLARNYIVKNSTNGRKAAVIKRMRCFIKDRVLWWEESIVKEGRDIIRKEGRKEKSTETTLVKGSENAVKCFFLAKRQIVHWQCMMVVVVTKVNDCNGCYSFPFWQLFLIVMKMFCCNEKLFWNWH